MTYDIPIGIRILPSYNRKNRTFLYKIFIIIFTFLCYTSYHLSRKPISVVKSELHRNCSKSLDGKHRSSDSASNHGNNSVWCNWKPFDGPNSADLFGFMDLAYLLAYAVGMFCSGHIAERVNLRYFMSAGMLLAGFFTMLFGFGYFLKIHSLAFFIIVQIFGGLTQATGWPSVVTCMGNWYGKGKRGFIMGVWNAHTSVGNILGLLVAGAFVENMWGLSFIVPGLIIVVMGTLTFLFLVPEPDDVGCDRPDKDLQKYEPTLEMRPVNETLPMEPIKPANGHTEYGTDDAATLIPKQKEKAISLIGALKIPGVVEFSLSLFFSKLVNYTFLFWLPKYISSTTIYDAEESAYISVLFDVGGIFGGVTLGIISDYTRMSATACFGTLFLTGPILYIYYTYGNIDLAHNIGLLFVTGFFVNGPYALITTAVSADLGTHDVLQGSAKALSTVTAIIDGTGSIGAAIGPLLAGVIDAASGWRDVIFMLIGATVCAMLFLSRLLFKEIQARRKCGTVR